MQAQNLTVIFLCDVESCEISDYILTCRQASRISSDFSWATGHVDATLATLIQNIFLLRAWLSPRNYKNKFHIVSNTQFAYVNSFPLEKEIQIT
jgi:hypothetical protein